MITFRKFCAYKIGFNILSIIFISFIGIAMGNRSGDVEELKDYSLRLSSFSNKFYNILTTSRSNENIVYSPFSIQSCVAMSRMGATGQTAIELDHGLNLYSDDIEKSARIFHMVLSHYANSTVLKIANRVFVMTGYSLKKNFQNILNEKFLTSADELNFANSANAAATINQWVESHTNNLIKNIISPSALSDETRIVLVNAIHFKGRWKHQFKKSETREEDFYLNDDDTVKVQMMNIKETFRYADLPELDATALELPYNDTDLSMLIILPKTRTGLKALEDKLQSVPLSDITSKLQFWKVVVKLPKFKAELTTELTDTFKQLGMDRMFSDNAEFGEMLDSDQNVHVSKIIHKAYIDVNEEGTEAGASTAAVVRTKRSLMPEIKEFIADRPFVYIINHNIPQTLSAIPIFVGSISKLALTTAEHLKDDHDEL